MFVYGIRCSHAHLADLPAGTDADYYTEHGILVFPSYSRAACLVNSGDTLTQWFLDAVKRLIENQHAAVDVDLEQPYITEVEDDAVKVIQGLCPGRLPTWYNIPRVASPETGPYLMLVD